MPDLLSAPQQNDGADLSNGLDEDLQDDQRLDELVEIEQASRRRRDPTTSTLKAGNLFTG
jgi:hypothetical protein